MAVWMQDNWLPVAVGAAIVLLLLALWLIAANRKTRVELAPLAEEGALARRNQALIDAPPAVSQPPITLPPATPEGMAGVGEVIAAEAAAVPQDNIDDLLRIKGVGPKLAQQLHGMGITRLPQIAGWNDADIDRIDAQLGRFQGRIRRDDWPEQARLLSAGDMAGYEGKFGRL
ncbi:MAG: hypothetical protein RLZZ08_2056 [Pseudomonadota bacterium]|jgi:predicted flap endonuclease-1-like 5' DNA nuclease